MGGYGGASKRNPKKEGCYKDSEGKIKIKDKNAIEVAEYYLNEGRYVVFYHEDGINNVPDLSVDFKMVVEVKGVSSLNPTRIKENIEKATLQIEAKLSKYPEDDRHEGKIILFSRYTQSFEVGYRVVCEGYRRAKLEGVARFQVEFWFNGEIHILE